MVAKVLLAVDGPETEKAIHKATFGKDVILKKLANGEARWDRISREFCDLVVISRSLIPEPTREAIQSLRQLPNSPEVAVLTEKDDPEEKTAFLVAGCKAVVSWQLSNGTLGEVIDAILLKRKQESDMEYEGSKGDVPPRLEDFISCSPVMQSFMDMVRRVVGTDTSLLILGETGVGKEQLVRAIHAKSPRAKGPLIPVHCAALAETLLESELFGHEKGAFTGAANARRGWFEVANGGTIFLDEVGDMPLHLQVKLLRVLQDHEVLPVGSEQAVKVDVRVMAATNRDLVKQVEAGRFREDLYYRLSVVTLTIPPLRERREDIPPLVAKLIESFAPRIHKEITGVSTEALEALTRHSWPGNIRELMNVIERAILLCDTNTISLEQLPLEVQALPQAPGNVQNQEAKTHALVEFQPAWLQRPLQAVRDDLVSQIESAYLTHLLQETRGRIGKAAERAGLHPRSLYDKMRLYGLRKEDFRQSQRP